MMCSRHGIPKLVSECWSRIARTDRARYAVESNAAPARTRSPTPGVVQRSIALRGVRLDGIIVVLTPTQHFAVVEDYRVRIGEGHAFAETLEVVLLPARG
jgi:hypothetical protein